MVRPIDNAPASRAPRLAASITPGPPPVITAKPARPRASATARAAAYSAVPEPARAEPKIDTAFVTPRRSAKPVASSADIRADRKSVVEGTGVAGRVDFGGRRILKKKKKKK